MLKSSKVALVFTILISGCSDGASSADVNSTTPTSAPSTTLTTSLATTVATTSSTVAETTTSTGPPLSSGDFEAPFEIVGPSAANFVVLSNPAPAEGDEQSEADFVQLFSTQFLEASIFVTTARYETTADWQWTS